MLLRIALYPFAFIGAAFVWAAFLVALMIDLARSRRVG